MTQAFGIDISKWQSSADGRREMDFKAVKKHEEPITFIAARASIGSDYVDPLFHRYWKEMKRLRVARIAYHVLYFTEDAQKQMDAFFKILRFKSDWSHDRLTLCLLVEDGADRKMITEITRESIEICQNRTGRLPIVYSKPDWINNFLDISALPALDWWIADYLTLQAYPHYTPEHPGPPRLPQGISNYLIHQTTEKGKSIGADSFYMSYNRWNGDKNAVAAYFGKSSNIVQAGDAEKPYRLTQNQGLFQAQCMVLILSTHTGPSSTEPIIGRLRLGEVVTVFEEKDGWFRLHEKDSIWVQGKASLLRRMAQRGAKISPLFAARVIVPAQYIRVGPGKEYQVVGNLVKNQLVEVFEERGGWYRIAPGAEVWAHGGTQYLQRVQ